MAVSITVEPTSPLTVRAVPAESIQVILTIVEPPVDDFGWATAAGTAILRRHGSTGSPRNAPAGPSIRRKTVAMARRGPNLASLLSAQCHLRHGRQSAVGSTLTMIRRSLLTGFSLIFQTDRMPAGSVAWGLFGESLNE